MKYWFLPAIAVLLLINSVQAANLIGPINVPTQAKEDAWASVHEPAVDEDYFYEDDHMIIWFDFSSGGFPRGIWLKENGRVLRSKNSKGDEVPTNLVFGSGYALIANLATRPDSPYENFFIFHEKSPRPGLPGRHYVKEYPGYTEIGFIGQLKNNSIKAVPGFDPNRDKILPSHIEPNPYIAQSWPENEERWVHVETDPVTRKFRFEKMRGDGTFKEVSYRIQMKIYHNKMKFDAQIDVFLKNRPPLDVILMCIDTFNAPTSKGSEYIRSLGATGLDTAYFDAYKYDNWLGIPPGKVITKTFPPGQIAKVKHVLRPDYPGNGATSFVVFKQNLRSPWIEITNGSRTRKGNVKSGLNVTIRREFSDLRDCSHVGFTNTPWFEDSELQYWWVSNELAFNRPKRDKDLEVLTARETVSFRIGK